MDKKPENKPAAGERKAPPQLKKYPTKSDADATRLNPAVKRVRSEGAANPTPHPPQRQSPQGSAQGQQGNAYPRQQPAQPRTQPPRAPSSSARPAQNNSQMPPRAPSQGQPQSQQRPPATFTYTPNEQFTRPNNAVTPKSDINRIPAPKPSPQRQSISDLDKKRRKKEDRENRKYEKGMGGVFYGLSTAVVYILFVITTGVVLAYNIIMIGNDVFAFIKPGEVIEVTVPPNATLDDVAKLLKDEKLIKYEGIFKIYAGVRKRESGYTEGTYPLSTALNYDEMMIELRRSNTAREVVRVTITEGMSCDEIIELLTSKGIGSTTKFREVLNTYTFNYEFLEGLDAQITSERKYRLEGYLFPDTYDFYVDSKEENVIKKFLDNFDAKFNEKFRLRCNTLEMTIDQVINLASIVQSEARFIDDFNKVASVFHNRLDNPANFPYLESDATIIYTFDKHRDVTPQDLLTDKPYNTYTRRGLPPSAVCNPGLEAINAALYSDASSYYYFVSDKRTGVMYYGATYAEHEANIIKAREGS